LNNSFGTATARELLPAVRFERFERNCLNPAHPRGRHKARVFASALGLTAAEAEFLRERLLAAAREVGATKGEVDEYGERYVLDVEVARGNRRVRIRSAWIIRRGERIPRLTSCYLPLD